MIVPAHRDSGQPRKTKPITDRIHLDHVGRQEHDEDSEMTCTWQNASPSRQPWKTKI